MIDVKLTADAAKELATHLRRYANNIDRHADNMLRDDDLTYVTEVLSEFKNCVGTAKLELLFSRPFKEITKD